VRAVELGLPEIGIADHVSTAARPGEDWCVRSTAWTRTARTSAPRRRGIRRSKCCSASSGVPGRRRGRVDALLDAWPFDLIVLGVHVVDGFDFDDPSLRADSRWDDPDELLAAYYRVVRRASEQRPVRHPRARGLHRSLGTSARPSVLPEIDAALDALAASGRALELNTDRVSDPAASCTRRSRSCKPRARAASADDRLGRARGGARRPAVGRGHRPRREAGYRETLRVSDHTLVPLPDRG